MKYKAIDSSLFIRNRQKITSKLKKDSLVILVSNDEMPRSGDQFFPFRQNPSLFYLTGIDQEETMLVLCPNHPLNSMREILFLKKTNEHIAIWNGHKYTKEEGTTISGITNVKWNDEFWNVVRELMIYSKNTYLNLPENARFATPVITQEKRFADTLMNEFPLHKYRRFAPIIDSIRVVKDIIEIELMKKACKITASAFQKAVSVIKPGAMEYEVEAEIIAEITRKGGNGHSFSPIVAGGKNTCVLHYIENDKELKDGDLVLMDFGAEYAHYAGDLSRTVPVNGKFSSRQKEVYQACLNVYTEAKKMFIPGNTINKLHAEVCQVMEKELIKIGLFTQTDVDNQNPENPLYKKYFMHGTSHFIGIDVHDVGTKDMPFQKGMVLSCEPGIYIPEENIGIRIETDMLVDINPIDLMKDVPVEIEDLENLFVEKRAL